jgi:hypothetical protein
MKHGKVLDRQTLDFAARVLQNLPELSSEEKQYLISNPKEIKQRLQALKTKPVSPAIESFCGFEGTALLYPVATKTVPARTKSFYPKKFYRNRNEISLGYGFGVLLDLRARRVVTFAPERTYVSCKVREETCGASILADLPNGYLSTLEDIAMLIEMEQSGERGVLRSKESCNVFLVEGRNAEVFSVNVMWHKKPEWDDEGLYSDCWRINAWSLDHFRSDRLATYHNRLFFPEYPSM